MSNPADRTDICSCEKCAGDGQYCWSCGERESHCECDDQNIGVCDYCNGTGEGIDEQR